MKSLPRVFGEQSGEESFGDASSTPGTGESSTSWPAAELKHPSSPPLLLAGTSHMVCRTATSLVRGHSGWRRAWVAHRRAGWIPSAPRSVVSGRRCCASPIIALDPSEPARQRALDHGADHALDPTAAGVEQKVRELTGGLARLATKDGNRSGC